MGGVVGRKSTSIVSILCPFSAGEEGVDGNSDEKD